MGEDMAWITEARAAEKDKPQVYTPKAVPKGWRYTPHIIIFMSSAFIMVVELVAGRLIARHLGSSLYTWTSIIGVVLAGMSIGNYLGGKMADRWNPERSLGWLFLAASLACVLSLYLNNLVGNLQQRWEVMFPVRVFLSALLIFILPALLLGTISPVTAKMALDRSKAVGSTIGSVYAWGAIGSILGTFATGFVLIAAPFQVACKLGLQEGEKKVFFSEVKGRSVEFWQKHLFYRDGNYQLVKVYEEVSEQSRQVRTLVLDYLIHGYTDMDDPLYLRYSYEKIYAEVAKIFVADKEGISAFFLGGGSYTFPRWVQAMWPDSACDVAEIDPLVLEASHAVLGLAGDTTIRTYLMDARIAVDALPAGRMYDLILGDVFTDLSIPYHLTTAEFQQKLARRLKPDGVLLHNVIDDFGKGGYLLGAFMLTLKKAFRHVYIFSSNRHGVSKNRDTFVVAAFNSDDPAIHGAIQRYRAGHALELDASLLNDAELSRLAWRCQYRILTDDHAPVENLIEPVVRARGRT